MLVEVLIPSAKHRYSFCKYLAAKNTPYVVVAVLEHSVVFLARTCIVEGFVQRMAQDAGIPNEGVMKVSYNDEAMMWSKELIDPAIRNHSWRYSHSL